MLVTQIKNWPNLSYLIKNNKEIIYWCDINKIIYRFFKFFYVILHITHLCIWRIIKDIKRVITNDCFTIGILWEREIFSFVFFILNKFNVFFFSQRNALSYKMFFFLCSYLFNVFRNKLNSKMSANFKKVYTMKIHSFWYSCTNKIGQCCKLVISWNS